jgi:hypothetical protein
VAISHTAISLLHAEQLANPLIAIGRHVCVDRSDADVAVAYRVAHLGQRPPANACETNVWRPVWIVNSARSRLDPSGSDWGPLRSGAASRGHLGGFGSLGPPPRRKIALSS